MILGENVLKEGLKMNLLYSHMKIWSYDPGASSEKICALHCVLWFLTEMWLTFKEEIPPLSWGLKKKKYCSVFLIS